MNDRAIATQWQALAPLLWGFAEATLFFIVPDVLLSWIALDRVRAAWAACLWALLGALAGGTLMYAWGRSDAEGARAILAYLPDVRAGMFATVNEQLRTNGVVAIFLGPITGTPYKIYAVQAGADQLGLASFLAASAPARLVRFAAVTGLTILVCWLLPRMSLARRRVLHVVCWTAFYVWFLML